MSNNFRLVKFSGFCEWTLGVSNTYYKHWGNCTYWPWIRQLKKDSNTLKEREQ